MSYFCALFELTCIRLKKVLSLLAFLVFSLHLLAQIPTTCFEIESILADACGSQEGLNEMVRFQIGPNDMDMDNLYVNWANISLDWEGLIQNSTTEELTEELNSTVESCGVIIEPVDGIIPAGANVLLATSYLMDPNLNSFADLSDTLYIIYQNANETNGHFSNGGSGERTLAMAFLGGGGCSDEVSYFPTSLIGGNGGTIEYDWDGNQTYTNNGCTAPIQEFGVAITDASPNSICPGESIDLEAESVSGATNIIWSADNGSFSSQSSLSTTYQSSLTQNTSFYIYSGLEGACGGAAMDSILITINPVPDISVSPANASICGDQTVTLTATGGVDYTWSTGEVGNSIDVNSIGTYYAIDNSCGSDTAYAEITLSDDGPTATIIGETSFCFGETISLTAEGGITYLWQDGSTSDELTVSEPGTYSVVVADVCGSDSTEIIVSQTPEITPTIVGDTDFCEDETITLTASGGTSYEWNNGETTAILEISTAGTYEVEVIVNNCSETTSIVVNQHFPNIDLGDDVEACTFNTILSPGVYDNYLWQDGSTDVEFLVTQPGSYSVVVTDEFGCEASDEVSFETGSLLLELGDDQFICAGEGITILAPEIPGALYQWQDGSELSSLTVTESGVYSVLITQDYCQAEDSIEVISYSPTAFFEIDTISGCAPVDVLLQDGSTSPAGIITAWDWNFGDGNTETSENPFHQYQIEGQYTISLNITTNDGCTASYTLGNTVEVFSSPTADFTFTQEQTEEGLLVDFSNQSTTANTWSWDFGDQEIGSSPNVIHLYPSPGSYVVTLAVSIENGCTSEVSKQIIYEPEHFIYIPTAFTPDMDGVNDFFIPVVSGGTISTYELSIFNRSGEKIYFTNDPLQVWLGGNHKVDYYTENDVYNYFLEILFEGEAEKTLRRGVVRIVR